MSAPAPRYLPRPGVFLVGAPRCGTTSLSRYFGAEPATLAGGRISRLATAVSTIRQAIAMATRSTVRERPAFTSAPPASPTR